MTSKARFSLAVIGHNDSGKSTVTGHLVHLLGKISPEMMAEIERECERLNRSSFRFAFVSDRLKKERESGISIETTLHEFETPKYGITLADCPGHKTLLRNFATGAVTSDACLLVVAAPPGEFEAGFRRDGQTKEHSLLAFTFGVRRIVVVVNKMDDASVAFSEARYREVCKEVVGYLTSIGFEAACVTTVPVSGWLGANLVQRDPERLPWYQGPTLIEAIDSLSAPARNTDAPLRLSISDYFSVRGVGLVPTGRIEQGTLRPGDMLYFAPSGKTGVCESIQVHRKDVATAAHGEIVGFRVQGATEDMFDKGTVASLLSDETRPRSLKSFTASVVILDHPGSIKVGYTPIVDCHAVHSACRISKIVKKVDRLTGEVLEEEPRELVAGDSAVIVFTCLKAICLSLFSDCPALGRLAFRDGNRVVGVGAVIEVENIPDQA